MYKVDLHTHSIASPDGGLTIHDYRRALETGKLDLIAVTDHDTIDFALELRQQLGERIIVGEEISTAQGELIGLYLKDVVPPGQSALETVKHIRAQGGLVYVPHPFETVRKGVSLETLDQIAAEVAIIETHNGRAVFQNRSAQTEQWAIKHAIPGAAGSDAHGRSGWGKTYSVVADLPNHTTLPKLLQNSTYQIGSPGIRGVLYPKMNRLKKKISNV